MGEAAYRTLEQCASMLSGGTPSKSNTAYWNGDIPWLTPKDMAQWSGETENSVTANAIGNGTRLAPIGSIFIAVRGMSLHNEIRIIRSEHELTFNQDIKAIVPTEEVDGTYLYYVLLAKKPQLLAAVESAGHGTGRLPTDRLKAIHIPDIPRANQLELAKLFAALDDKIELNRRMNETLEAMARTIFRDWFVDFGPTRAKMESRAPYLTPDLWALFPDRLDDDGKPEGWRKERIGELSDIVGGATPSTKNPQFWEDGMHAWATPKDLSKREGLFLYETDRSITDAGLAAISSGLSPAESVLLSSRAPIGYLAIAEQPTAVNQGFIVLRPTEDLPTAFAMFWCQSNMEMIKANANGSTFQEISKRNFRPLQVVAPDRATMNAFIEKVSPLLDRIRLNGRENQTLAATRDLLLPKLMSGEIRVAEVEDCKEDH